MKRYIFLVLILIGCANPMISVQAENIAYSEDNFYRLAETIEDEWANMNFPNRDAYGCLTNRNINIIVYSKEEFIDIYSDRYYATTDARHEITIRQDFYEERMIDAFVHEMLHIAEKCALDADINARINHSNYLLWDRNNSDSLEQRVIQREINYLDSIGIEYVSYYRRQ